MKDYVEITDPYEVADICDALSNSIRVEILNILKEHREITVGDLLRELEKRDMKMSHAAVRMHIPKLVFSGIVEFTKIEGKDALILKKDVKIFVKEVDVNGE